VEFSTCGIRSVVKKFQILEDSGFQIFGFRVAQTVLIFLEQV
jgi:hypothetical protein